MSYMAVNLSLQRGGGNYACLMNDTDNLQVNLRQNGFPTSGFCRVSFGLICASRQRNSTHDLRNTTMLTLLLQRTIAQKPHDQ